MIRTSLALALICVLLTSAAQAQDSDVPSDKNSFHLFLLVGQSNMAGRGAVEDQDREIHPRVLMFNKAGEWIPAVDPLHFDKPAMVGVGLGKTFALDYAKQHPHVTVGLIPCAVGGSPIATWEPGAFDDATKTHPYDDAISRAHRAIKSGTLKGILWHQGESDSNPKNAPLYKARLHGLIKRFRQELKAPDVPFIAGQMGQFAERPWNDDRKAVDAVHRRLPDEVANTAFADSDGLLHKGDEVHFDSKSYRELGHRYFAAFQSLNKTAQSAP